MDVRDLADEAALQEDELLTILLDEEGFGDGQARAIGPREKTADPPLSFGQQRLWFLDQLVPGEPLSNLAPALRLSGKLDVPALERSLSEITRRHETLRTTFRPSDGQPVQVIGPAAPLTLSVEDLGSLPRAELEAAALRLAREEARRPFDLARGPLLRATLLWLAAEEHVLLLTIHHIVFDGWSAGVLWRELGELYQAYVTGCRSPLPELPIQYADFAVWQRERLRGEVEEAQLAYWKRQLADLPVLNLPTDRPRPAVQSFRGDRHSLVLPKALSEALEALGRREGATPFMTLLAAFQALLARYTGQGDVVVGSLIAGRNRLELEPLIGFFLNTLVLRTDVSGDPTFRELLARVRGVALGAYAHQELPFEQLVEALRPERDPSRNPLFQVAFALQNAPTRPPELRGLTVSQKVVETGMEQFDLSLSMRETEQGLDGSWRYSTDLFDARTIVRMAGHFRSLLEGIVADPDRRLSELPLLTEPERHRLLVEWNATATEYPSDRCIHELIEAQTERTPDAVAVVFEEQRLTYRELNARANRLAHHLRGLGVGPEVLVGICVERSLEMVIGLLGILKAGGAYVPLDPSYPNERLAFMLADARVPVLLAERRLAERLPDHRARAVFVDADRESVARWSAENPAGGATAKNLAYVIYTSGSTGRPKGVAIEHRSAVALLDWAAALFDRRELAGVLASTSVCFDLSVFELFVPLCRGGTVILVKDVLHLRASPTANRATLLNTVPSAMAQLVRDGGVPPSVRTVVLAGEPLQNSLVQQIYRQGTVRTVYNCYGPTEATTYSTFALIGDGADEAPAIGRPIPNTRVYVLDRHLQPAPVGMPGELHIGGDGLARGYLNRPELTAEAFIPDPFSGEPGARLYRTGDLARYRPDGNIELLGRLDDQVKIRGFRVEPGEVEAILVQHPAIREAIVLAREAEPGDKRLVAYVIVNQDATPPTNELRGFLRRTLPDYMVPSTFVWLEGLPLTPNGKLDRHALPAPDGARAATEKPLVAPRTPLEIKLVEIWQDVLGVRPIGVTDDFFELGGHSLLAARLFARIEVAVGKALPLATLFRGATIEHLADALSRSDPSTSSPSLVAVQPHGARRPFFCVHNLFGDVFLYDKLARHLGRDRPFYALQARGLDGPEAPITRIEAMAAHYVDEIRRVQPEGPYALGGLCASGAVAFEMACQLRAQGQAVALVAVLDGSAPGPGYGNAARGPRSWRSLVTDMPDWLTGALQLTPEQWSALLRIKALRARAGLVRVGRGRAEESPGDRAARFVDEMRDLYELTDRHRRVAEAFLQARRMYTPRVYPGRVTLFRARMQPLLSSHDPAKGWRRLAAGGVEIKVTPGNLLGMLREPHVRVLAEQLRRCLERSELGERAAETALAST